MPELFSSACSGGAESDGVSDTGRPCLLVSQHPGYFLTHDRFLLAEGWIEGSVIKMFSPFLIKEQLEI